MNHISNFLNAKLAAGRQTSTIAYYQTILKQFESFMTTWPPEAGDIKTFFLHKRATCNEVSIHTAYIALRVYFNWCHNEHLLDNNPIDHVEKPKKPQRLPKAISLTNLKKLFTVMAIQAADGNKYAIRDLAILRLAYDTGCRASELGDLKIDNLDVARQSLLVESGKGQKDRLVYFGDRCCDKVTDWLEFHPGGDYLFCSRKRRVIEPLTRRGLLHIVKKWQAETGIKMTMHQFRHSYATHALRRGIPLNHVQKQLGHVDITTTAVYLAVEDEERRQIHQKLAPGNMV